jgi:hypothetical protein
LTSQLLFYNNILSDSLRQGKKEEEKIGEMDGQPQVDASKLSTSDQKELNQFLMNEAQKSTIQQSKLKKNSQHEHIYR